jgi:hypothetical protein
MSRTVMPMVLVTQGTSAGRPRRAQPGPAIMLARKRAPCDTRTAVGDLFGCADRARLGEWHPDGIGVTRLAIAGLR